MILTRVYPLIRFLEIVNDQEITFIRPKLWDDPWEGFFINKRINSEGGNYKFMAHDKVFALSLSQHTDETDYGWKAYSPNKDGILIFLDAEPFIESTRNHFSNDATVYSDKVKYKSEKIINDRHNELFYNWYLWTIPFTNEYQKESLFTKRNFFKHEKEHRIIIWFKKYGKNKSMIKVPIDVNKYIKKIVLDPKTDPTKIEVIKSVLRKVGYKNPIIESKIAKPPSFYYVKKNSAIK